MPDGTQERKRERKAIPSRVERTSVGCLIALAGYLAICVALYQTTAWRGWIVLAAPGIVVAVLRVIRELRDLLVLVEARRTLQARGISCLVVYSDSPTWHARIQEGWLPTLGCRAATLNWSARATWPRSLEVRLFRRFIDARTNYNPAVLVFRGLRRPTVFRFYYAFQQAKHGRTQYLDALEADLFRELGVDTPRQ
jgi:hypothetical protein